MILKVCGILLFSSFKILLLLYPDYRDVFKLFSSFGILLFLVVSLYQYLGFENFQTTNVERAVTIAFLGGSTILAVGFFFKILHWPFASPIIIVGLGIAAISFAFTLFIRDDS